MDDRLEDPVDAEQDQATDDEHESACKDPPGDLAQGHASAPPFEQSIRSSGMRSQ